MFFYEGQACPVCGKRFSEQEDIVACPECGCPHHRDCWQQEGHCHFAADHGTERQWAKTADSAPTKTASASSRCPRCGASNPEFAEFCSRCGCDLDQKEWHSEPTPPTAQYTPPTGNYSPYGQPFRDPYGGVPRTETIDGIAVDDIAKLIGPNSAYYLPRFYRMTHGGSKLSWNWASFFFSCNWLLYRKNILWGSISAVFMLVLNFISQVASDPFTTITEQAMTQAELMEGYAALLATDNGRLLFLVMCITSLLTLVVSVVLGLFGNYLYLRSILKKAHAGEHLPASPYKPTSWKGGGVSFFLAILPNLITAIILYTWMFLSMF